MWRKWGYFQVWIFKPVENSLAHSLSLFQFLWIKKKDSEVAGMWQKETGSRSHHWEESCQEILTFTAEYGGSEH